MTLEYDPEKHQYLVDGRAVPSVTQLVAPLGADFDDPDDMLESVLDAATDRGATMHAYIEHRLLGGAADEFDLPSIYLPYADAVELFLSEHTIVPLAIETPMATQDFAGTPDLVCEFDGIDAILDWKVVSQIAKSKVGTQLAGYEVLCVDNGLFPEELYAVQFLKTGDYRLYPVGRAAAHTAFDLCRGIHSAKAMSHPRGRIFPQWGENQ